MPSKPLTTSVSRRAFIVQSGMAAAATAAFAGQQPVQPSNKRGIKRALKFNMIRQGETILEKFTIARGAGFEGVEFGIEAARESQRDILDACAKTGMEIPGSVAGGIGRRFSDADPKVRAEAVETFRRGLETTRDLGGTTVLLYPGIVDADNPYDAVYERMQESVRAVIPTAEQTGVKIAFENVWNNFLLSPLEARDFVDSFDSPLVGWYFDVGNVVTNGWPEQWIRILGSRVFKLDIKEYSRTVENEQGRRRGFNVELMEGDCNWPAVMRAVDEVGYSGGWGSAEVRGGDAERLRFIADRMHTIFNL